MCRIYDIDDHSAGVDSGRSQYFSFEPESTLRSVEDPIKIFKGPNFGNDAGCCRIE